MANYNKQDDLLQIERWVRKQDIYDGEEIKDKAKTRVYKQVARSIRKVNPLEKGNCQLCSYYAEKLVPTQMSVCRKCVEKFRKRGYNLVIKSREFIINYCDNCLTRSFSHFKINPEICLKCSKRIGMRQKHEGKDYRKAKEKFDKTVPWKQTKE